MTVYPIGSRGDPFQKEAPIGALSMDAGLYLTTLCERVNSVCQIILPDGHQGGGFLIGQKAVMTNYHVFEHIGDPSQSLESVAAQSKVRFSFITVGGFEEANINALVIAHKPLDFAIVTIENLSHNIQRLRPLSIFTPYNPREGMPIKLIHYLGGERKSISESSVQQVWDNTMHYTGLTQEESSGFPIVGSMGELFALHSRKCLHHEECNMGYLIRRIAEYIRRARNQLFCSLCEEARSTGPFLPMPVTPLLPIVDLDPKFAPILFGVEKWRQHFECVISEAPPFPPDINAILASPSPFWPDRTMADTCVLILIFKKAIARDSCCYDLTLKNLEKFTKDTMFESLIKYRDCKDEGFQQPCLDPALIPLEVLLATFSPHLRNGDEFFGHEEDPICQSYWALITRDLIPNSLGRPFMEQVALVQRHGWRRGSWSLQFRVSRLIEIATMAFTTYERLGFRVGNTTYTRCEEVGTRGQMVIGSFTRASLIISSFSETSDINGKVGVRAVLRF